MLIERLTRARLAGGDGQCDITMAGGIVDGVVPASPAGGPRRGPGVLDLDGRVVVPAFIDAHVHLDKAFLPPGRTGEPSVETAIAAVAGLRDRTTLEATTHNATRAVDALVRHGVVAARVQAEVEPKGGLALLEMQLELAAAVADRCTLQVTAFPQLGLEAPGAVDLLAGALSLGVPVVGGCPYVDGDAVAHLDAVFDLADRHGVDVDLHLDLGDDPGRSHLRLVVERTRALGMAGHVVVGHVTTLAAMSCDEQARALDDLAAAGIGLVTVPVTDLHLSGHGEPGTRSIAPFDRAAAAGVRVAVANNNLANPFSPFGNGNLLQAAWLAGIMRRAHGHPVLLDAITATAAALLGLPSHGPRPGAAADLVVLDTTDATAVVEQCPAVLATIRAGVLVSAVSGVAT